MLTTKPIMREYDDNICRRCINEAYKVSLRHRDCVYGRSGRCPRCGERRHIVSGFTLSGMKKMFRAKNVDQAREISLFEDSMADSMAPDEDMVFSGEETRSSAREGRFSG